MRPKEKLQTLSIQKMILAEISSLRKTFRAVLIFLPLLLICSAATKALSVESCDYPKKPMSLSQFKYVFARKRITKTIGVRQVEYYSRDPQRFSSAFESVVTKSIEDAIPKSTYEIEKQVDIIPAGLAGGKGIADVVLKYKVNTK